jgi:uncharacterized transporter YbjL
MSNGTPIELEEAAKRGHDVPAGQTYVIRIDKEKVTVEVDHMTGRQILELVKKDAKLWKLFEHVRGNQPREIQPDEDVSFTKKGIERFSTFAKDTTEGVRACDA